MTVCLHVKVYKLSRHASEPACIHICAHVNSYAKGGQWLKQSVVDQMECGLKNHARPKEGGGCHKIRSLHEPHI